MDLELSVLIRRFLTVKARTHPSFENPTPSFEPVSAIYDPLLDYYVQSRFGDLSQRRRSATRSAGRVTGTHESGGSRWSVILSLPEVFAITTTRVSVVRLSLVRSSSDPKEPSLPGFGRATWRSPSRELTAGRITGISALSTLLSGASTRHEGAPEEWLGSGASGWGVLSPVKIAGCLEHATELCRGWIYDWISLLTFYIPSSSVLSFHGIWMDY